PMAASLAYGLDKASETSKTILVYDLGGGTFDISILMLVQGAFTVMGHSGDTHLGGDDFDQIIMNHLLRVVRKEHGVDLSKDRRAMQKIRSAAEEAKIVLSSRKYADVILPAIARNVDLEVELSRAQYEDWIREDVERSIRLVREAVRDTGMPLEMLDHVLLVGGPTYTPLIQAELEKVIGKEKIQRDINPMLCVAMGAALQTGLVTEIECPNPNCKQKNPMEAEACAGCGTSLVGEDKVICPACFMPNNPDRAQCRKCGASLVPVVVPVVPLERPMWKCPECGKPNPPDQATCNICGAQQDLGGLRCHQCGQLNAPGAKTCAQCGADIKVVVLDVTAKDLGIELQDGRMATIIPKGTGFPTVVTSTKTFYTVEANQRRLEVPIYEGENPVAKRNDYCGMVTMELPEGLPKGTPVAVSFDLDADRVIYVTVQLQDGSGKEVSARIKRIEIPAEQKKRLEEMRQRGQGILKEGQEQLGDREKEELEGLVKEIKQVLDEGDSSRADEKSQEWQERLDDYEAKIKVLNEITAVINRATWTVDGAREYMDPAQVRTIERLRQEVQGALDRGDINQAQQKARELNDFIDRLGAINIIVYSKLFAASGKLSPALRSRVIGALNDLQRAIQTNNRLLAEQAMSQLLELWSEVESEISQLVPGGVEEEIRRLTDTKH
ncbi:MAG TPA: hypothetical protein EYP49_05615, partial [Anaerolineae bacterium]|nr:hypothetical protein [Anaerolineae bacterium]